MRILLIGDVESKYVWDFFDKKNFKDIDFIVSCGDLKATYLSFLVTMINRPLFYVPGNHDKRYLVKPPEGCINIHNKVIEYKGIKIYGFGGSNWYSGGPFQFKENEVRKAINKNRFKFYRNGGIDIFVSHSPAFGLGDGEDKCHTGFKTFNEVLDKYKPKYHFHGHQHLNYGRQERTIIYKDTTIVNAFSYYILEY